MQHSKYVLASVKLSLGGVFMLDACYLRNRIHLAALSHRHPVCLS